MKLETGSGLSKAFSRPMQAAAAGEAVPPVYHMLGTRPQKYGTHREMAGI